MAIAFIDKKKRQKYLSFVLIIILLLIIFVFGKQYLPQKEFSVEIYKAQKMETVEIDFNVLENPILKQLQPFDEDVPPVETSTSTEVPIEEVEVGRENPFIKY